MLLKHKDGYYAKAYVHENGTVSRWCPDKRPEVALLDGRISECHNSLPDVLSEGWEIVPPTFETLTMGDVVKDFQGNECRVLAAEGCGKFRIYSISAPNCPADVDLRKTAKSMPEVGFTIPTQSTSFKEMTVSEVSKLVGQPVKIVEG